MISLVSFLLEVFQLVFASIVQLAEFHVSLMVPSHDMPDTFPSSALPSHLQTLIGFAITIQFPH